MPKSLPRRRIVPSVPLALTLRDDDGSTLQLDLKLNFDFNAIALVEEHTGCSLLAGDIWQKLSATTLSVLFWASLLGHQPEYEGRQGLEIVRSYMDAGNAADITKAVTEAFIVSLPPEQQAVMREAAGTANPTAPAAADVAPAGSSSGPSLDTTSACQTGNSGN